eukprot:gene12669-3379_t
MPETKSVEIFRSPTKGFGFSVIGGSNTHLPPMICALASGGPAASSGKIGVGDVVETVNGINARELPTRSNPEARSSAKSFLSYDIIKLPPRESRSSETASPAENRPERIVTPPGNNSKFTSQNSSENKKKLDKQNLSPCYKRTVGSPDYDLLGADGRFTKAGSLARPTGHFTFEEKETSERSSCRIPESYPTSGKSSSESRTSPRRNEEINSPKETQPTKIEKDSPRSRDKGANDTTAVKRVEVRSFLSLDDLCISEILKQENRLSKPVFGSAPRISASHSKEKKMKQNHGLRNVPNIVVDNSHRPALHRRSASHDEQTWNYLQRQTNTQDYRAPVYTSDADTRSFSGVARGARTGPTVRFEDASSQKRTNPSWSSYQPKDRRVAGPLGNGNTTSAHYVNPKSANNAQDLRNAFIKHQIALRNQKLAGFSQRRYNSSEELPSHDNFTRLMHQNVPISNPRGVGTGKDLDVKSTENFEYDDEDEDDMQRSGYGVGFKRTNSLGRADIYQRYSRNHDFYYTDRTHVSQYKDNNYSHNTHNNDMKQAPLIPRLSPALQQRLMNVTLSNSVNYSTSSQTTGIPNRNATNFDQSPKGLDMRTDYSNTSQTYSTNAMFNTMAGTTYSEDAGMSNGVPMRDAEDGMVHSRYEQGKSLIVPTQPFAEDFLSSSGDGLGFQNKNRGSIPSRMSVGSRISDLGHSELSSPLKVPDELKTIDATDLATRLFTLDGFSSDDVAPLLGKNSEFSQQVCNEYMKFLNFEGYSIDEALRILLQKFPLTGETQERERILLQFSKRYHECNKQLYDSEDAVHTLTCALMLLNTDLHGQNIGTKMTLNEFINNLSGLNDGEDFSRELLKTLYQSIKTKEILYATNEAPREIKPSPKSRKPSSNGNPFIELKADDDAVVMQNGMLNRKCIMDADGRRCPPHKRRWKTYYCILKGLVLFLRKHDREQFDRSIGIHHSLAGPATDYRKRNFVFKLITADWRVFLFEAKSKADVQGWVDAINITAAALSSPPLPAPCSSSKQFTRPVMPVSVTRLNLEQQIKRHSERAESIDKDMQNHRELQPNENSKDFKDWVDKMDYLEFEYKRFSAYGKVLSLQRLKQRLDFLMSSRETPATRTEEAPSNRPLRSSSMNDIERSNGVSPATRRKMRESYLRAIHN